MRPDRPTPLSQLERDLMHQTGSDPPRRRGDAQRTLGTAESFRAAAQQARESGHRLPAVSQFHEAARVAVTATATLNGFRFRNTERAHEAVVDYALAIGLVTIGEHARLDYLRELRHRVNYPADLIEPTDADLTAIARLVEKVVQAATSRVDPPKRIPPPPGKR